jgi:acetone carboxylase gamma subunit
VDAVIAFFVIFTYKPLNMEQNEKYYRIVKDGDYLAVALQDGTVLPKQQSLVIVDDLEPKGMVKCTATIEFYIKLEDFKF